MLVFLFLNAHQASRRGRSYPPQALYLTGERKVKKEAEEVYYDVHQDEVRDHNLNRQ